MQIVSSPEIKRQILKSVNDSPVRERIKQEFSGDKEGLIIEMGNDFDAMIRAAGWKHVEEYLLNHMDLIGLATNDNAGDVEKGIAKGYIRLMQYIELIIQQRDSILEREKIKHET